MSSEAAVAVEQRGRVRDRAQRKGLVLGVQGEVRTHVFTVGSWPPPL